MSIKIKVAGLVNDSIVDGPGLRFSIFTQGCPHHCVGCHNPHTHDPGGGSWIDLAAITDEIKKNPLLTGVTFSGGEPFMQAEALTELARDIKALNLHLMVYSGYLWEDLIPIPSHRQLLEFVDILVDGPFVQGLKSLDLKFRGSTNQRCIQVPNSLYSGEIILMDW